MPEARSSTGSPDLQRDPPSGSPTGPLGWWSLTPSVSIAVFLLVAMFTLDSSGSSRIGLALITGVLIGPPASYLLNRYWPAIATGDHPAPPTPSPGAKP
ncbi:MAG: hypothetical protein V3V29_00955 [Acidimicrobiia bacterium]